MHTCLHKEDTINHNACRFVFYDSMGANSAIAQRVLSKMLKFLKCHAKEHQKEAYSTEGWEMNEAGTGPFQLNGTGWCDCPCPFQFIDSLFVFLQVTIVECSL
jgi:hypothetical protein